MAHVFLRNSLNNSQAVKLNLAFIKQYDANSNDGDPIWLLEIATTYPSASGTEIKPVYVNKSNNLADLDEAVTEAFTKIASQIDWGNLSEDTSAPYITEFAPYGSDVSIASNVAIKLVEDAPASGIDLSEMRVVLNTGETDLDITSECIVNGTPFEYSINWQPSNRITEPYDKE